MIGYVIIALGIAYLLSDALDSGRVPQGIAATLVLIAWVSMF